MFWQRKDRSTHGGNWTGLQPKDSPECQTCAVSNRKRFSEMVKMTLLFSFVN